MGDLRSQVPARSPRPNLAPDAAAYLEKHGVPGVLDDVWSSLLADKPADPLGYMVDKARWGEVA